MDKPFKFKQFTIHQDQCAMKIGTDGVLLGAWTSIAHKPFSILDVGAGTGIIALMLAQRSNAENIEAIEIDNNAYEQCTENFEDSPWADRLFCYHAGLDEFTDEFASEEAEDKYDLIVSNPPFYSESVTSGDASRDMARQNQSLPFEELISSVAQLLSTDGIFSVIIPFHEEENFIQIATEYSLFPKQITRVKGNATSEIKRSLLEFNFYKATSTINELVIEKERHQYTDAYKNLTKDFYLKM